MDQKLLKTADVGWRPRTRAQVREEMRRNEEATLSLMLGPITEPSPSPVRVVTKAKRKKKNEVTVDISSTIDSLSPVRIMAKAKREKKTKNEPPMPMRIPLEPSHPVPIVAKAKRGKRVGNKTAMALATKIVEKPPPPKRTLAKAKREKKKKNDTTMAIVKIKNEPSSPLRVVTTKRKRHRMNPYNHWKDFREFKTKLSLFELEPPKSEPTRTFLLETMAKAAMNITSKFEHNYGRLKQSITPILDIVNSIKNKSLQKLSQQDIRQVCESAKRLIYQQELIVNPNRRFEDSEVKFQHHDNPIPKKRVKFEIDDIEDMANLEILNQASFSTDVIHPVVENKEVKVEKKEDMDTSKVSCDIAAITINQHLINTWTHVKVPKHHSESNDLENTVDIKSIPNDIGESGSKVDETDDMDNLEKLSPASSRNVINSLVEKQEVTDEKIEVIKSLVENQDVADEKSKDMDNLEKLRPVSPGIVINSLVENQVVTDEKIEVINSLVENQEVTDENSEDMTISDVFYENGVVTPNLIKQWKQDKNINHISSNGSESESSSSGAESITGNSERSDMIEASSYGNATITENVVKEWKENKPTKFIVDSSASGESSSSSDDSSSDDSSTDDSSSDDSSTDN